MASQLMARYQVKAGHKVAICTTNVDFPNGTLMVPSGKPVFRDGISIWQFPVQFRPLLLSIQLWRWLRSKIMFFDIVHIHGLYRFPVSSAAWWARRRRVPYVITPHGALDPFLYRQSQYSVSLKRIYEHLFDIPNLNHAAAVHYTAEDEAERAAFLKLRTQTVVVPNGIDWESYRRYPPMGSFRRQIKLHESTPLILFLGRINFKKGLDLLVSAFGRVVQKHPTARLAIVGPDNEGYGLKVRRWCNEQGLQDKVFFVDHLGLEKVKEAYVDADVFVLPSHTENFGLTVIEAMACGTPVVISDQVNIWRRIQEARAGIVVCLDPCAVADAICMVLDDKRAAGEMGARGRIAAEKIYAWPGIIKQFNQVYRELISENQAGHCRPAN